MKKAQFPALSFGKKQGRLCTLLGIGNPDRGDFRTIAAVEEPAHRCGKAPPHRSLKHRAVSNRSISALHARAQFELNLRSPFEGKAASGTLL